ncbi:PREDICTED: DNA-damage-repair/toleration protein DRT100-like [Erythranthe guttata]|uniref:DNA-damage-repair/toleration protein DRT100-like n=1 Tax=Erythranthe guttata TaxID=4155 RepID=UPI00064E0346|nr:PREDICTED: DNA-damage-repair/toleration protein DRT100-like [Erythranthe guttata]|eukprot:XP_012849602.1 PREDICTED: DNA-damage-repair/toleration protein DRT100-like [Erythranthe guttata]
MMSGEMPSDIGKLEMLNRAIQGGNQLTRLSGSIPSSIGTLSMMANLDLSTNRIFGSILGEIRSSMTVSSSLNLFNSQLSNEISGSLSGNKVLSHLNLSRYSMERKLPHSFSPKNYFIMLDLSYNKLTGKVLNSIRSVMT